MSEMSRVSRFNSGDSAALAPHCVRTCHLPGEKHADQSSTYAAFEYPTGCPCGMGLFRQTHGALCHTSRSPQRGSALLGCAGNNAVELESRTTISADFPDPAEWTGVGKPNDDISLARAVSRSGCGDRTAKQIAAPIDDCGDRARFS